MAQQDKKKALSKHADNKSLRLGDINESHIKLDAQLCIDEHTHEAAV